ncbi:hypothetical protein ACHAP8_008007 [Fusarium lateritium]
MTTPLQNLPNEIMDIIFNQLTPSNVWSAQQSSKSIEHALDFHLLARRHAVDELMEWGCTQGSIEAINKAVSLGADPNLIEKPTKSGPFHSTSTIALASNHPYLVNHLFRLGANLRLAYVYEDVHQEIFLQQKPQLLKSCLNHSSYKHNWFNVEQKNGRHGKGEMLAGVGSQPNVFLFATVDESFHSHFGVFDFPSLESGVATNHFFGKTTFVCKA